MKLALLIVIIFLPGLFLLHPVYAQTVTPTPIPVDYTLPYPGILPDNPLYKIKAFRDWIISKLISDPLKKATFDVLQADKRLVSAQDLLDEAPPNAPLAVETLSKGENYFFEAIMQMKQAHREGESMYDITQKLRLSSQKHLEVVEQMEQRQKGEVKQALQGQEKRIQEFINTVGKEGPQTQ